MWEDFATTLKLENMSVKFRNGLTFLSLAPSQKKKAIEQVDWFVGQLESIACDFLHIFLVTSCD